MVSEFSNSRAAGVTRNHQALCSAIFTNVNLGANAEYQTQHHSSGTRTQEEGGSSGVQSGGAASESQVLPSSTKHERTLLQNSASEQVKCSVIHRLPIEGITLSPVPSLEVFREPQALPLSKHDKTSIFQAAILFRHSILCLSSSASISQQWPLQRMLSCLRCLKESAEAGRPGSPDGQLLSLYMTCEIPTQMSTPQ